MLIYGVLIFVLVTVGSMALLNWFIPNKSQRRLQELAGTREKTDWIETVVSVSGPLAKLSIPEGKWEASPLRIRFINAGIRHPNAGIMCYAAKTTLPLVFAAAVYFALQIAGQSLERNTFLLVLLMGAILGCYFPNIALRHAI